jgi:antitoxin component of MazEF toxin-antitoxin module
MTEIVEKMKRDDMRAKAVSSTEERIDKWKKLEKEQAEKIAEIELKLSVEREILVLMVENRLALETLLEAVKTKDPEDAVEAIRDYLQTEEELDHDLLMQKRILTCVQPSYKKELKFRG